MKSKEFIKINTDGWNNLIRRGEPFSNISLPEWGPFMENESKLQILKDVRGKRILDLGCASGKDLEYLLLNGAKEVCGLDVSEEQIKIAKRNPLLKGAQFWVSPMEKNPGIPEDYFDYVLSLYSIGYSSDPIGTINLAKQYLKNNGQLIISWLHPFFNCLAMEGDKVIVSRPYSNEDIDYIKKGVSKVKMVQYNLKVSTLVNGIIETGLVIDRLVEGEFVKKNGVDSYGTYWAEEKVMACPTTLIIVAHKE